MTQATPPEIHHSTLIEKLLKARPGTVRPDYALPISLHGKYAKKEEFGQPLCLPTVAAETLSTRSPCRARHSALILPALRSLQELEKAFAIAIAKHVSTAANLATRPHQGHKKNPSRNY